jgi:anti-anti-sigma regulatory factor
MLQIRTEQHGDHFALSLSGQLAGDWVGRLERFWNTIRQTIPLAVIVINLANVSFVDPAGRRLLEQMSQGGTVISATGDVVSRHPSDVGGHVLRDGRQH